MNIDSATSVNKKSKTNQKNKIIMPVATANWLQKHTNLTDTQIMKFCDLDIMEINMAAKDSGDGFNPLNINITLEEIRRCEQDKKSIPKLCFDFRILQHKRCRKSDLSVSQKHHKINYLTWFKINHANGPICFTALATMLRMQSKNLKNKWAENHAGITAISPIVHQVCDTEYLNKKVLIICTCCSKDSSVSK